MDCSKRPLGICPLADCRCVASGNQLRRDQGARIFNGVFLKGEKLHCAGINPGPLCAAASIRSLLLAITGACAHLGPKVRTDRRRGGASDSGVGNNRQLAHALTWPCSACVELGVAVQRQYIDLAAQALSCSFWRTPKRCLCRLFGVSSIRAPLMSQPVLSPCNQLVRADHDIDLAGGQILGGQA